MKVTFVTATELDPFTASALNLRFYGFLLALAKDKNLDPEAVVLSARRKTSSADSPSSCRAYPIAALIPPPDCTIFRLKSSARSPI